jgi:hypothetical protein
MSEISRRKIDKRRKEIIMSEELSYHPDTLSLHAGQQPDPTTGARARSDLSNNIVLFQ